jgi:GT2 family glycosyltransferase
MGRTERISEWRLAPITLAVSTRERPHALGRLLATLREGARLPAEIVVVDQSRDDGTAELVSSQPPTANIVYVRDDGSGLGTAQNIGFQRASFPVIAVTDDDCVPAPDWVARIAAAFAADGMLAGITGRVLPLAASSSRRLPVATRVSTVRREFSGRALPWLVGSGNNFAVRKEWLARIGGNDERLGPGSPGQGGVDLDLFYRLLRAGARIVYEPGVVVQHETATVQERLARRGPYGHGVGAGTVFRLFERDAYAAWILACWLASRARRLGSGLARGDRLRAREELLVLAGTVRGIRHGVMRSERRDS